MACTKAPRANVGAEAASASASASAVAAATPHPLPPPPPPPKRCGTKAPVVAYWAGWSFGGLPPEAVSFDGITDVVLFSLLVRGADIDEKPNGLAIERVRAIRDAARAKGVCVHVAFGGEKTAASFELVDAMVERMTSYVGRLGLDGLVLDVEPLADAKPSTMRALLEGLRPKVPTIALTITPGRADVAKLAPLAQFVDRIDVMTYLARDLGPAEVEAKLRALPFGGSIAMGLAPGRDGAGCRSAGRFLWEVGAYCKDRPRPCALAKLACP